jgi:hypothetical protein
MSKRVSIAAVCTGLLCMGLCACDYVLEQRPKLGAEPDWELAWSGAVVFMLGVRGLLGFFDA